MTGSQIKNAIRGKGLTQQEAAQKLGISRTTLDAKLNRAKPDDAFLQLVQEKLGISIKENHSEVNIEKVIGETTMIYNSIPLKNKRLVEVWFPTNLTKGDFEIIEQWMKLYKSTL